MSLPYIKLSSSYAQSIINYSNRYVRSNMPDIVIDNAGEYIPIVVPIRISKRVLSYHYMNLSTLNTTTRRTFKNLLLDFIGGYRDVFYRFGNTMLLSLEGLLLSLDAEIRQNPTMIMCAVVHKSKYEQVLSNIIEGDFINKGDIEIWYNKSFFKKGGSLVRIRRMISRYSFNSALNSGIRMYAKKSSEMNSLFVKKVHPKLQSVSDFIEYHNALVDNAVSKVYENSLDYIKQNEVEEEVEDDIDELPAGATNPTNFINADGTTSTIRVNLGSTSSASNN